MKSLQRKFNITEKKNPYYSSYICFVETIKNREFSSQAIRRWFYKLVDKNDYDQAEKKEILKDLLVYKMG